MAFIFTQGGARGVDQGSPGVMVAGGRLLWPSGDTVVEGVALVDVLEIDCSFGHDAVVGELSRDFEPGQLYGVAGPNGAGKSTLLLTVAGELEPISGTVRVDGVDPGSPAGAGRVARVAEPVFYPDLSVGEHLKLLHRHLEVEHDEIIETWRLKEMLPVSPGALSSGQRQRLFLSTQLFLETDVFVIDEPERHLDSGWVEFLCAQLRTIARAGTVVMVASHSSEVLAACDDVVRL